MNNNTIIGIIVVLLVVVGGWYLIANTGSATPGTDDGTASTTTTAGNPSSGSPGTGGSVASADKQTSGVGSIQNLLALKQNISCSVSYTAPTLMRTGTVYIAGGRMRGDFFTTVKGKTNIVSMIDDGDTLYAWSTAQTTGLKLSAAVSASGSALASWGALDPAASLTYFCHPWSPNLGFFDAPSNITFSGGA